MENKFTSAQYISSLSDNRQIFINGERVDCISQCYELQPILRTISKIIDEGYNSWGKSFQANYALQVPCTQEELSNRLKSSLALAKCTYGCMSRLNDYNLNFLLDIYCHLNEINSPSNSLDRIRNYINKCKKENLVLSHAISHPQIDRKKSIRENNAVRVVRKNSTGVIVEGARMISTMSPLSNEVIVHPFGFFKEGQEDLIISFAIPLNTKGVSLHARPLDTDLNDPLSPFDEPDASIIFDQVLVPYERIFFMESIEIANSFFNKGLPYSFLGSLARSYVRLEFLTSVCRTMLYIQGIEHFQQNQKAIGNAAVELLSIKSLLDGAILYGKKDENNECFIPSYNHIIAGLIKVTESGKNISRIVSENCGTGVLMRLDPSSLKDYQEQQKLTNIFVDDSFSSSLKTKITNLAYSLVLGPRGTRQFMFDHYAHGDPLFLIINLGRKYTWELGSNMLQDMLNSENEEKD